MRHRHHGCGPRGHIEIQVPEALLAMRGGRGWQGNWGPFHFDFGDEGWSGGRPGGRARPAFAGGAACLVVPPPVPPEPPPPAAPHPPVLGIAGGGDETA